MLAGTMFGIAEVISLLLSLSGFGLQANAKAPTADQALRYALPDADIVVHFDVASVIPGNFRALTQLADQPQIKASPELAKLVREAVTELEGPRGLVKAQTGIDFVTDFWDTTAFFQIVPQHDPQFVIASHGHFTAQMIDKIAAAAHGNVTKVGGAEWAAVGGDKAIGLTKDGVLLGGTTQLVMDRMADAWKPPGHGKDTTLGYAADAITGKPVLAIVLTLSQAARTDLAAQIGPGLASDLVRRHKMASLALYHDGVGWSWVDTTKGGLDSMAELSDGAIDLLRAAQVAPRGFAKVLLGAIDSYKGDPRVDQIIAHKADIMKIVDSYVGDGQFKTKVDKDPSGLRLNVRVTGKSLSEVVPLGVVVPMGLVGMLVMREPAKPAQIAVPPPPGRAVAPPPAAPPAKKK